MKPSLSAIWILLAIAIYPPADAQDEPPPANPDEGKKPLVSDEAYEAIALYIRVLEQVHSQHPDADLVTHRRLVNHSLEGMLSSLDPFSAFYHPETAEVLADETVNPELRNFGFTLGLRDSGLYVMARSPHGPAHQAGLLRGDSILHINEEEAPDDLPAALELLRAIPAGKEVTLAVQSLGKPKPRVVTLTSRVIREELIPTARLLTPEGQRIAWIRLAEFQQSAPAKLTAALDQVADGEPLDAIILDLRGNPGGLIQAAVALLGEFLAPGTHVVSTRQRLAKAPAHDVEEGEMAEKMSTPARKRPVRSQPLAILIDRDSASASELVAGALQDLERATIIGETSYGKGSVQTVQSLGGGTALRLTIATYHTPSGRTPHLVGIEPDLAVPLKEHDRTMFEWTKRQESLSPKQLEELKRWRDPVLTQALKALKSR